MISYRARAWFVIAFGLALFWLGVAWVVAPR